MTVFHWMRMVPFLLVVAALIAGLLVLNFFSDFFAGFTPATRLYLNTVGIALIIHLVCFRLYNYFLKVIIITNYRLIDIRHSVFLRREQEDIAMTNVQDCHFQQRGLLPRLFKYGDLIIMGSNSDIKYTFHGIPKVAKMHNLINAVQQKYLRRNGAFTLNTGSMSAAKEPAPTA